jgi:hypothetical protein
MLMLARAPDITQSPNSARVSRAGKGVATSNAHGRAAHIDHALPDALKPAKGLGFQVAFETRVDDELRQITQILSAAEGYRHASTMSALPHEGSSVFKGQRK